MWTPEYYVRYVEFPPKVDGLTVPNDDGTFDIYINTLLSSERQEEKLKHEIRHIQDEHFYRDTIPVAQAEQEANGQPVHHAHQPEPPKPDTPPLLPDMFFDCPPGKIPFFASLQAFHDYMFAMRDQAQAAKSKEQKAI